MATTTLYQRGLSLCHAIEALPSSEQQTALSMRAAVLLNDISIEQGVRGAMLAMLKVLLERLAGRRAVDGGPLPIEPPDGDSDDGRSDVAPSPPIPQAI